MFLGSTSETPDSSLFDTGGQVRVSFCVLQVSLFGVSLVQNDFDVRSRRVRRHLFRW